MKTLLRLIISLLLLTVPAATGISATLAVQQSNRSNQQAAGVPSEGSGNRMSVLIADEVRHRLTMLSNYGVFDWLECDIRPDRSAVIRGQVLRPGTKSDAESALRKIEGLSRIDNQIEVLPISPSDDQIRIAVYRSIFKYDSPMFRYAIQSTSPVHIIVNNGRVTLKGVVDSAADSQLAFTAANGISGVFEVKNELIIANRD